MLQRQLSSAGAVVTESKMVEDRVDGEKVEIDVAVELTANELPLIIGFEVRSTGRRIDRNAAIAIIGKYRRLVDKTVIVSRQGFTRRALKYCKEQGVSAITFADAAEADWGKFLETFKNLHFVSFEFAALGGPIIMCTYDGQPFRPLAVNLESFIICDKEQRISLTEAGAALLRTRRARETIMKKWYARPIAERYSEYPIVVTFTPNPSTPALLDQNGYIYRVVSITYKIAVRTHGVRFPLSPMRFGNRKVMQGSFSMPAGFLSDKEICVLVSEGPENDRKAGFILQPKDGAGESTIHDLELDPSARS